MAPVDAFAPRSLRSKPKSGEALADRGRGGRPAASPATRDDTPRRSSAIPIQGVFDKRRNGFAVWAKPPPSSWCPLRERADIEGCGANPDLDSLTASKAAPSRPDALVRSSYRHRLPGPPTSRGSPSSGGPSSRPRGSLAGDDGVMCRAGKHAALRQGYPVSTVGRASAVTHGERGRFHLASTARGKSRHGPILGNPAWIVLAAAFALVVHLFVAGFATPALRRHRRRPLLRRGQRVLPDPGHRRDRHGPAGAASAAVGGQPMPTCRRRPRSSGLAAVPWFPFARSLGPRRACPNARRSTRAGRQTRRDSEAGRAPVDPFACLKRFRNCAQPAASASGARRACATTIKSYPRC